MFEQKLKELGHFQTIPVDRLNNPSIYPRLFIVNKNGKLQEWYLSVTDTSIIQTDGFVDGKLKESNIREIPANKVRTQKEQISAEAERRWIDKIIKGYQPHPKDSYGMKIYNHVQEQRSKNGGMKRGVKMFGETQITPNTTFGEINLKKVVKPMLAETFQKREKFLFKHIKQKMYIQPKLDGKRAVSYSVDGKRILQTRGGKMYLDLDHITDELSKTFPDNIAVDGELYIHELWKNDDGTFSNTKTKKRMNQIDIFQLLGEMVKHTSSTPHPQRYLVKYYIFDVIDEKLTTTQRQDLLDKYFEDYLGDTLVRVETDTIETKDEIDVYFNKYISDGYEGAILRLTGPKTFYTFRRSPNLIKVKSEDDSEFIIIGAEKSSGGLADGTVVWIVQDPNDESVIFSAKQMGDSDRSRELYKEHKKYIGKLITVLYNGRTKDNKPRFPRALRFRDD